MSPPTSTRIAAGGCGESHVRSSSAMSRACSTGSTTRSRGTDRSRLRTKLLAVARDFPTVLELVGNTPIVKLTALGRGVEPTLLAKLEYLNPGGSVKDRIGLAMIEKAERDGKLRPGGKIVEPTSGNTGVGR